MIVNANFWKKLSEKINVTQPDCANLSQFYFDYQDLMMLYLNRAKKNVSREDSFIAMEMAKSCQEAWIKFLKSPLIQDIPLNIQK